MSHMLFPKQFDVKNNSPRASRHLFYPESAYVCMIVSMVESYADLKNACLTKIGCRITLQFHFKEGYPP